MDKAKHFAVARSTGGICWSDANSNWNMESGVAMKRRRWLIIAGAIDLKLKTVSECLRCERVPTAATPDVERSDCEACNEFIDDPCHTHGHGILTGQTQDVFGFATGSGEGNLRRTSLK